MKNYILGLMAVIILFLISIIYKEKRTIEAGTAFPILEETKARVSKDVDVPLYLYIFFSNRNCYDCLQIVRKFNNLEPYYIVTGIVPEDELINETKIRYITGATFPLISRNKYKRFLPWYSPSIFGVAPNGIILFILPGVPQMKDNVRKFLESLYGKLLFVFLRNK